MRATSATSPKRSTDLKMETPGAVAAQLLKSKGISVPPCLESNTDPINTLQTVEACIRKQFPFASLLLASAHVQTAGPTIGSPQSEEHQSNLYQWFFLLFSILQAFFQEPLSLHQLLPGFLFLHPVFFPCVPQSFQ